MPWASKRSQIILQHTLYLLMFTCRYEQMKHCAVQIESAAGGICIKSLITASRQRNRHNMLWSSSSVLSYWFFFFGLNMRAAQFLTSCLCLHVKCMCTCVVLHLLRLRFACIDCQVNRSESEKEKWLNKLEGVQRKINEQGLRAGRTGAVTLTSLWNRKLCQITLARS